MTSPNNSANIVSSNRRNLQWWEIQKLEKQGCTADAWKDVVIHPATDLTLIRNVEFLGINSIGILDSDKFPGCGLHNVTLENCTLADGVRIRNIGGGLKNVIVEKEAVIENTARIEFEPEANCGVGIHISVLDETGSRPVILYPGLSAQSATLMARMPQAGEDFLYPQAHARGDELKVPCSIGEKAIVRDCGKLFNVSVGREVKIEGTVSLSNGAVINNAAPGKCLAYIGAGVNADGFIIEDGIVNSGSLLRNVYVGQGARLDKGFTAHDSLFFANSAMENGEACAILAGPYSVSMHKGTLLIGCQTSFMNAGSSTNQSNHMYKLGPVHWGVLERGVKTSSNSYLMLGANIGAFSLLMGQHKSHPDSTELPFSYLFGDAAGCTVVVPAMMLKSCGMMRDQLKWPKRDLRQKRKMPLHDRISFEVLNPFTVDRMLSALEIIATLIKLPAGDDHYLRYKGMKISRASLERAKKLYTLAIYKYLSNKLPGGSFPKEQPEPAFIDTWVDLAGQIMPRRILEEALKAESVSDREAIFDETFENYQAMELDWILRRFPPEWKRSAEYIAEAAGEFDAIIEADRISYRDSLTTETEMLAL